MKAGDRRITKDEEVHIYTTNDDVCWGGGALVYCTLGNEKKKKKKKEENKRNLLRVHCEWVLFLYTI
jgi:uncharacterized protein YgiB involved in biofilm formation